MNCSDYEELLSAYASDELPRAQKEFIEGHLSNCPECQKALDGYISIRQHLGVLNDVQLKPNLKKAVMSKIKKTKVRNNTLRWLRPALVSLVFVALLTTIFIIQPWNSNDAFGVVLAKIKTAT